MVIQIQNTPPQLRQTARLRTASLQISPEHPPPGLLRKLPTIHSNKLLRIAPKTPLENGILLLGHLTPAVQDKLFSDAQHNLLGPVENELEVIVPVRLA